MHEIMKRRLRFWDDDEGEARGNTPDSILAACPRPTQDTKWRWRGRSRRLRQLLQLGFWPLVDSWASREMMLGSPMFSTLARLFLSLGPPLQHSERHAALLPFSSTLVDHTYSKLAQTVHFNFNGIWALCIRSNHERELRAP